MQEAVKCKSKQNTDVNTTYQETFWRARQNDLISEVLLHYLDEQNMNLDKFLYLINFLNKVFKMI